MSTDQSDEALPGEMSLEDLLRELGSSPEPELPVRPEPRRASPTSWVCPECDGTGRAFIAICGPGPIPRELFKCPTCNGVGVLSDAEMEHLTAGPTP